MKNNYIFFLFLFLFLNLNYSQTISDKNLNLKGNSDLKIYSPNKISIGKDKNINDIKITITKNDTINAYNYGVNLKIIPAFQKRANDNAIASLFKDSLFTDKNGQINIGLNSGTVEGNYLIRAVVNHNYKNPVFIKLNVKEDTNPFVVFLGLLGGLAIFIFGMHLSSKNLQAIAGNKMKSFINKLTNNKFKALLIGIFITFLIQSSSAVSVMLIGFTSAELIAFPQTVGILLGSNIGTTLTVQMISFNIGDYALGIIGVGFLISILSTKRAWIYIGKIILGFGFIFFGMKIISTTMSPLKEIEAFSIVLNYFAKTPFSALIVATIFTTLIQSSAATIGIILSLAMQGSISLEAAIPFILGANIGTCITGILAAFGQNTESKKVAFSNVLIKLLGVIIFIPFINLFSSLVELTSTSIVHQIANAHTIFNIVTSLILIPFLGFLTSFVSKIIKNNDKKGYVFREKYLNENLLKTPGIALDHVLREILRMAEIIDNMFRKIPEIAKTGDSEIIVQSVKEDDKIDLLENRIKKYLIELTEYTANKKQLALINNYLYIANIFESMGDVIVHDIYSTSDKMIHADINYSEEGLREIISFHTIILEAFRFLIVGLRQENENVFKDLLKKRKYEIRKMELSLVKNHIERLKNQVKETTDSSSRHIDMISSLKRFNSLTNRIAHIMLDVEED